MRHVVRPSMVLSLKCVALTAPRRSDLYFVCKRARLTRGSGGYVCAILVCIAPSPPPFPLHPLINYLINQMKKSVNQPN